MAAEPLLALADMMDAERNGRLYDAGLRTAFDLSQVSWIIQAPNISSALSAMLGPDGAALEVLIGQGMSEDLRRLSVAAQAAGAARDDPAAVDAIYFALQNNFAANSKAAGRTLFEHALNVRHGLRIIP
ncbi:hypothetical protein [Sphingomonas sp. GC_Shp_3]|uniref:hypothetical protein n=2 Tax=unclassified Sphingomonas TaxID=196159 RepID=UPI00226AE5E4|nr:hypothetical protein [Sphingomonas sp. GC_Shp_3]